MRFFLAPGGVDFVGQAFKLAVKCFLWSDYADIYNTESINVANIFGLNKVIST